MTVLILSLRKRQGERRLSLFNWQRLWVVACVCGLPEKHSFPASANICTLDSSQQKSKTYREGGQGEGERGRKTAGSEGRMRATAVWGDFKNIRLLAGSMDRDSGNGGEIVNILGRGGGNGALGLWGRDTDIVVRAVMGWLTEWRRYRLINPAASGIIY